MYMIISISIPPLTQVINELLYRMNDDIHIHQISCCTVQPTTTHLPSCWTEEWSRERSRELSSSSSLKEESSSSMFCPSLPASFSLVRRSWTSSRVVAPPDVSPEVCVCVCVCVCVFGSTGSNMDI